jgi:hypothetical protein
MTGALRGATAASWARGTWGRRARRCGRGCRCSRRRHRLRLRLHQTPGALSSRPGRRCCPGCFADVGRAGAAVTAERGVAAATARSVDRRRIIAIHASAPAAGSLATAATACEQRGGARHGRGVQEDHSAGAAATTTRTIPGRMGRACTALADRGDALAQDGDAGPGDQVDRAAAVPPGACGASAAIGAAVLPRAPAAKPPRLCWPLVAWIEPAADRRRGATSTAPMPILQRIRWLPTTSPTVRG